MRKALIHAVAHCKVCDKQWEDYLTAQAQAAAHSRKTGHHVIAELGYIVDYGAAAGEKEKP